MNRPDPVWSHAGRRGRFLELLVERHPRRWALAVEVSCTPGTPGIFGDPHLVGVEVTVGPLSVGVTYEWPTRRSPALELVRPAAAGRSPDGRTHRCDPDM